MINDKDLNELYASYLAFADQMAGKYDAMAIAAIMMTQALSLYRTALPEEEYDLMIENIIAQKDKVKKFERPHLQ